MMTWLARIIAPELTQAEALRASLPPGPVFRSAEIIFDARNIAAAEDLALRYARMLGCGPDARVDSVYEVTPAPPAKLRLGGRAPGLYVSGERVE